MKKQCGIYIVFGLFSLVTFQSTPCQAQGQELQQLLLNIEKLTQMKSILSDMKTGYQIYQQGYGTISSLSKGNFNLHSVYLNGLMAVSPGIRNYGRVAEIISMQSTLISEYKRNFKQFRQSGTFSASEINYMSNVYNKLIVETLDNIGELTNVITANKLRMSDADRIKAIDRIYATTADKFQFLRSFNNQGITLSLQRSKATNDTRTLKQLYGITN
ncbi:TerB family tellurite resistance protein [Mucilaginibacter sp.]|uniref:TerB family tellurite resistance protein n=1 Tax=Mucilaginibacter sp. TaxID=1882438 RepID=UPI0035BBED0B